MNRIHVHVSVLATSALLTLAACDGAAGAPAGEFAVEELEQEERLLFVTKPWHGRWEGHMTTLDGPDYDSTLVMNHFQCLNNPTWGDDLTAEWDYYTLGVQCTSDLSYLGTSLAPDGTKTYTFHDSTKSGPCMNGLVDLRETDTPGVMLQTWRTLDNTIDAQGLVEVLGNCTQRF
ncbi:MAG: hypothetical protein ACRBN8_04755 [Nannocystales bacterium]